MQGIVNVKGKSKNTVDRALDPDSTNPVQNKVIKEEMDKKVTGAGMSISFATVVPSSLKDGAIVMVYEE